MPIEINLQIGHHWRALHCLFQRLGHKKIGAEAFGEFRNVVLDNGEDKNDHRK